MDVNGRHYRTIWVKKGDSKVIQIIDQRKLPHEFVIVDLKTVDDFNSAIKDMLVRGAPLIGATAAYGIYVAALDDDSDASLKKAAEKLISSRPTAIDLKWAVEKQLAALKNSKNRIKTAFETANKIAEDYVEMCRLIGIHGVGIIEAISKKKKGAAVNILTHCNAGWLATVDYGTATAPIYEAFNRKIDIHVWVDETRPWNQGAKLTAWELGKHGVPSTLIADNAGGHLMQHGMVDMCIVGSDRTTRTGDVANKIGTYLKALAAKDNNIPFYVALPSSTFDWKIKDGVKDIQIEERGSDEVKYIEGLHEGKKRKVLIAPEETNVKNYSFDVTPARLVTGLITERGVCRANEKSILNLFPEKK
ncbi:S-methyl-5-thioribose-1-phosphate isomerase [Candidatus Woesearchaeota archaeon]|nr:S-methyl-5-thioribose-1-phosphate isomerase [Candidatus Woesearchaeota archaeon]